MVVGVGDVGLKFRFTKKVADFETISHLIWSLLSKCQIKWEIVSNFCGLFIRNVRTLCTFLASIWFKISWNLTKFQLPAFSSYRKLLFQFFLWIFWMSWNFVRFQEILKDGGSPDARLRVAHLRIARLRLNNGAKLWVSFKLCFKTNNRSRFLLTQ